MSRRILDELVIANPFRPDTLFDGQDPHTRDFRLDMLDATWEDANGRLPHEPGYVAPTHHAPPASVGTTPSLELLDAIWEDENGRMPHEPGYSPPADQRPPATVHQLPTRRRAPARSTGSLRHVAA